MCWTDAGYVRGLAAIVDTLQRADQGNEELDARIDGALNNRDFLTVTGDGGYRWRNRDAVAVAKPGASWSRDLTAALRLVPNDFGFSLGRRDSICWAWIQPDDGWRPAAYESRHDHPLGSGLIVAYTTAIALTAAAIVLRIRWDARR